VTDTTADLICGNCGHVRSLHFQNEHCGWTLRGGPLNAMQSCPCNSFVFAPEQAPAMPPPAEEEEWTNPVTLTAAAAVAHIDRGDFDPYIELLLSALHQRKLALRGVRGFPRMDREGRTRRDI